MAKSRTTKEYRREWRKKNRLKVRKYARDYAKAANQTPVGKAKRLWSEAKLRAARLGLKFDLTQDFVICKLSAGVCEATGLRFEFHTSGKRFVPGPRTPSLDRIVSSGDYTMDNVRAVVWQYNLARNAYGDASLVELARAISRRSDA